MKMLVILIILACILIYIVRIIKYRMYHKPVPRHPGWLPLIGHGYMFLGKNQETLWALCEKMFRALLKQGGIQSLSFSIFLVVHLSEPDDAEILVNKSLEKHFIYKLAKPWFGDGLIIADVPTWKVHRKVLNQSFTHQALSGFTGVFNCQAKQLLRDMEPHIGKPFNPGRVLTRNDLKSICKTTTGIDPEVDPKLLNDYSYAAHNFLSTFLYKAISYCFYGIFFPSNTKKYDLMKANFHKLASTLLHLRKTELLRTVEKKNTSETDNIKPIIDNMIKMAQQENLFTEEEIKSELDLILFAGHDTTATTMHFILLLLGSHPEVQEKAYEEVLEVFGNSDKDLDHVDLTKLIYIECILKEAMRLYPVAPLIGRTSATDIRIKDYTIPAGTPVVICIWAMHRHSLWGEDPDAFRPERWLDPAKAAVFSKAFYAFSAGRRGCIGKSYAMLSMKITLAHVIRKYKIKSDISKLTLKIKGMLKPSSGKEITVELRNK